MMEKIVDYGTTHSVTVLDVKNVVITVVDENNEGYFLIGHGLKTLPKVDDKGTIVFTKHNGPTKGYWKYYPKTK
ncbi:MAG: hypothetical protein V4538_15045 [Bacteroidota bacterium]